MKDYLIRGMDKTGKIRILAATTTNLVEKARTIHNTSPTATAALGRTLTAAAIMGNMLKNENDVLTLSIEGDGPAGGINTVAKNNGRVKGYIVNPEADVPSTANGKLDVGGLVGSNGTLTTIMDLGLKEPYIGKTNLVTGEIAEDLVNYYAISEQQPSAVALGVLVDRDISVKAAGGYIIQLLPGVTDEEIDNIENTLSKVLPVSTLIDEGKSPEEIVDIVLKDFDIEILEKQELDFVCDCSREKIEKVIISLGKKEIEDIIEEDGEAEIVCHFCNSKYKFERDDLTKILNEC